MAEGVGIKEVGGGGFKAISDWQERKLTNIYKEVERGISKPC